ncbi:MAG: hypothetical protein HYX75_06685 [Acidobacteria bacterium]|nr:hypothetical protein [Acidobacteriota bacterium]
MKRPLWILLILVAVVAPGCRTDILHGLAEHDSNEVIAVLQEQGIYATKELENAENNTWKVTVPRRDAVKVWGVLQEYRLPATPGRMFKDVFGKSKLVVAPIEEKALYLEALQGEMSHTLEAVSGVVAARVHVVLPEIDITGAPQGEAKASVMIEYRTDSAGQAPLRVEEVQKLVANGIKDLKTENVGVVMKAIQMARREQTYDWVAYGPIVVAQPTIGTLKAITVVIVLLILALGGMLWWQGRIVSQLRDDLVDAQRQVRSLPKPAKPAA